MQGYWCDIGNSKSLPALLSGTRWTGQLNKARPEQARVSLGYLSARPTSRYRSAGFRPCVICEGVSIGHDAVIGRSVIHSGSRIGAYSRVVSSVIDGGSIGEACIINGTVVCRGAMLYPDTVTATGDVIAAGCTGTPPAPESKRNTRRSAVGLCREIPATTGRGSCASSLWALGSGVTDFSTGITLVTAGARCASSPMSEESCHLRRATGAGENERLQICKKIQRDGRKIWRENRLI